MFPFILIIFSLLVAVNIYLYLSGLRLRQKLRVISRKIADEEIAYEVKKLETAYIMEAYESLKKATFQEKFLPGIGHTPHFKHITVDEGYTVQRSFVSFMTSSIRQLNDKYKTDIRINVIDGIFNISFAQSLTIVRILLLLAEKHLRKEICSTSIFVLAHGPVQFSIESKIKDERGLKVDFLLHDQLMNSSAFRVINHEKSGDLERFVIGVGDHESDSPSG